MKALILIAALALTACSAPEPISWRMERDAYQANVAMFACREAKARGERSDCSDEIKAAWSTNQDRQTWKYHDIGGAGYLGIK